MAITTAAAHRSGAACRSGRKLVERAAGAPERVGKGPLGVPGRCSHGGKRQGACSAHCRVFCVRLPLPVEGIDYQVPWGVVGCSVGLAGLVQVSLLRRSTTPLQIDWVFSDNRAHRFSRLGADPTFRRGQLSLDPDRLRREVYHADASATVTGSLVVQRPCSSSARATVSAAVA